MKKELNEFMVDAAEYINFLRSFSEKSKGTYVYIESNKDEPFFGYMSINDYWGSRFILLCQFKKPKDIIMTRSYFDFETADYHGVKLRYPSLDLDDFCKELWKLVNLTRVEETHNFFTGTKTVIYCLKSLYDSQLKKIEEAYQRVINGNEKKEKETNYNKGSEDKYDKLFKLKKLLDDGAISKEEYNIEKKKILD